MTLGLLATLPFHQEILQYVGRAAMARGLPPRWAVWTPEHPQDFLQHATEERRRAFLAPLRDCNAVVCADYPYPMIRDVVGDIPIVATRHSLASRNNTWMPEQAEADWLVTWSAWDESEFRRRDVLPRMGFIRAGCVWAPWPGDPLGVVRDRRPTVLWAPTWNRDLSHRIVVVEQLRELARDGWRVRVRPHFATAWREPHQVAEWAEEFELATGDLMDSIAGCDVLVSDCSGAGLSGLLLPGGGPPVVWVGEMPGRHPQVDEFGPEWTHSHNRVSPDQLASRTAALLDYSDPTTAAETARRLLGTHDQHPAVTLVETLSRMGGEGLL